MADTITGHFATRRTADLAIEHLVQDHGLDRGAIDVMPVSDANSAGERADGADVESGHPDTATDVAPALAGALAVTVDLAGADAAAIEQWLVEAGATEIRRG